MVFCRRRIAVFFKSPNFSGYRRGEAHRHKKGVQNNVAHWFAHNILGIRCRKLKITSNSAITVRPKHNYLERRGVYGARFGVGIVLQAWGFGQSRLRGSEVVLPHRFPPIASTPRFDSE